MASGAQVSAVPPNLNRAALVRRGRRLNNATFAYNAFEGIASILLGVAAGSVALFGFGLDSVIELGAASAARWRLNADDPQRRAHAERTSRRAIGWSFLALAAYIMFDGVKSLVLRERPLRTLAGILVLTMSAVVMPVLARAKRRIAVGLSSGALRSEAKQTALCAYLSLIALVGVALNAALGWWWADPVVALAMVPIIVLEGLDGVRPEG